MRLGEGGVVFSLKISPSPSSYPNIIEPASIPFGLEEVKSMNSIVGTGDLVGLLTQAKPTIQIKNIITIKRIFLKSIHKFTKLLPFNQTACLITKKKYLILPRKAGF